MSEWISVKDRLPQENGYYLVWLKDTEPKKYYLDEVIDCSYVDQYYYDTTQMIFSGNENYFNMVLQRPQEFGVLELTHWMPLPDRPKDV